MISKFRRTSLSLALTASALGAAAWSPHSMACAVEPFMASVCIMAWPKNVAFGGSLYTAAAGQVLEVGEYQALFSIIGDTYGGNGTSTFALPDLRGRVVVGAGQGPGLPAYNYAATGGAPALILSVEQLPTHAHPLSDSYSAAIASMGSLTANTSVGTLQANTTLGTLAVNTTAGNLAVNTTSGTLQVTTSTAGLTATLNASSGLSGAGVQSPAGNALPTMTAPNRLYTTTVPPTIAMSAGSVTLAGSVTATLSGAPASMLSGTPASTLTGAPVTTLIGKPETVLIGAPSVELTGTTDPAPEGPTQAIPTMPPFTALVYYIATGGIYPTPD